MAKAVIAGCALDYELLGPSEAPCLALTPGGRAAKDALRSLAEGLATRYRVLLWDRRNTGASDIYFGDAASEQELWADDLAALLQQLQLAPCYLGGGSAGARVSLLTALRHPETVKGLVLWQVTGGPFACQVLGVNYHVPYIRAAQKGGMDEVAQTEFFAERIAANPGNRERLLALDPGAFINTLRRWNTFFYYREDTPVIGVPEGSLRAIQAPILVFEGNDDIHPKQASDAVERLAPNVEPTPAVWSGEEFYDAYTGRVPGGIMQSLYPRMVNRIIEYLDRQESRQPAQAGA